MSAPLNEDDALQIVRDELEAPRGSARSTARGQFGTGRPDPEKIEASQRKATARVDEVCDDVLIALPTLGKSLQVALDGVSEALLAVLAPARAYDTCADDSRHRLEKVVGIAGTSPRVKNGQYMPAPTVDEMPVADCHADRHLAGLLVPVLRELGAPRAVIEALSHLAQAAREIPS